MSKITNDEFIKFCRRFKSHIGVTYSKTDSKLMYPEFYENAKKQFPNFFECLEMENYEPLFKLGWGKCRAIMLYILKRFDEYCIADTEATISNVELMLKKGEMKNARA